AALQLAGLVLTRRSDQAATQSATEGRPRILLIRPDHLGDTLLATPAARLIREALPGAQVDWLVGPWAAEIARRAGSFGRDGEVVTLEFPGFTRKPKRSPLEPYQLLLHEAARLRARQYDAALILRPDHWWGALLAAAAGIPRRFGYAVLECQPFLTDTLPPPAGHVVEANQSLARLAVTAFGGTTAATALKPAFPVSDEDAAWAGGWLSAGAVAPETEDALTPRPPIAHHGPCWARISASPTSPPHCGIPTVPCEGEGETSPSAVAANVPERSGRRPLIVVHPGSGAAVKNWLPGRWAEVIASLRESHDAEIVLTGGPGERDLVNSVAARLDPPPPTLAGQTTLGQLAALYAAADLVIGGDSGPLHLAAAVGAPTLRLYGPTDIVEFGPWPPDGSHVALTAAVPCQPCRNLVAPPCGAVTAPACLRAITPDMVIQAASDLLVSKPNAAIAGGGFISHAAEPC
ncbi:MAG: glycosyltransferase family 9 protein, partial [Chloroflexota bacterium]